MRVDGWEKVRWKSVMKEKKIGISNKSKTQRRPFSIPAEQLPQTRLETAVALVVMNWPGVQFVRGMHARSELVVGAAVWYSRVVHWRTAVQAAALNDDWKLVPGVEWVRKRASFVVSKRLI